MPGLEFDSQRVTKTPSVLMTFILIVAIVNFALAAMLFLLEPWADRRGLGKLVASFRMAHVLIAVACLILWLV